MSKHLSWLLTGLFAITAVPASATCSCQCVEGVARTACSTIEEAQTNPNACGSGPQKVACDVPPPAAEPPMHFAPPAGASDCRSARLWDPRSNAYSAVANVCDLDREAAVQR
jgi:hypothetical protein